MSGTRMGKTIEGTKFEILKLKKKGPPSADDNAAADGTMDDPFRYIAANPPRGNQDASTDALSFVLSTDSGGTPCPLIAP